VLKLKLFNQTSALNRLLSVQSTHKRLIQLLSENNVPRLRQILDQKLKAGASIAVVLRDVEKAIMGQYHPKGYTETDLDLAELALILGGPRMLYALNQECGFASKSVVLRREDRPRFITSVGNLIGNDILTNLESFFLRSSIKVAAPAPAPAGPELANSEHEGMGELVDSDEDEQGDEPAAPRIKQTLVHMMIDDVNMEARRRPSPADGKVRGYGRESNFAAVRGNEDLEVRSFLNLQEIKSAEDNGDLVLAQEMTVFALGKNDDRGYNISLVGASGSAKKGAR
jgi:hypothetical protein